MNRSWRGAWEKPVLAVARPGVKSRLSRSYHKVRLWKRSLPSLSPELGIHSSGAGRVPRGFRSRAPPPAARPRPLANGPRLRTCAASP